MSRYDVKNLHKDHNEIFEYVIKLSESKKKNKKKLIRKLLSKYHIDISYNYHIILATFVSMEDFIGARKCIELGGDPHCIMDDDCVCEMDSAQKIRMDGLFRSFGYECKWKDFNIDSLRID
jgi:hypothetical protein